MATIPWTFPVPDNITGTDVVRAPTFADSNAGDVLPVTNGNPPVTQSSIPPLTFQVRPLQAECNPHIPQTAHNALLVALADGSVRGLAPDMAATTFWGAVTPAGGEVLGNDW